jgi:glycosyltransferase involved in cell wall biosynthesis
MMKNELPRLGRLMASLEQYDLPHRTIVLDTGSDDGSEEFFRGRPNTEVFITEWDGFGPCRTKLMALAHQKADWLLCLDCDDTLVVPDPSKLLAFLASTKSLYLGVASVYPDIRFYLPRLVSGRTYEPWKFVGRAHEYMANTDRMECTELLHIVHKGDGHGATDRLGRNLALLLDDARENPKNGRTAFYIGNTYSEMGKAKEAVKWYDKRLMIGGWDEETYCCMLYRARNLGSFADLMLAYKFRPTRAEALYSAINLLTQRGDPTNKLPDLRRVHAGIKKPYDKLFVETAAYAS